MGENTWTVLQFIEDGSVEAVPSTWVQGDHCHWPVFAKEKLLAAIKKCELVNTCWPVHRVKLFRNATYDNYMKARTKAKLAESTSDLNTESESHINQSKRKRIQKFVSSSSSDESMDDNLLPPPPNIQKYKKKVDEKLDTEIYFQTEKSGPSTEKRMIPETSCFKEQYSNESTLLPNPSSSCGNCIEKDKVLKALIQQGHIIRGLVTDTLSEIQLLGRDFNATSQQKTLTEKCLFNNPELSLPIQSDEDFVKIESHLENEVEFNKAVQEVSRVGGSSVYDFMKRALQLLLINEYALKYSWLGRKGKMAFHSTNISRLLINSAEAAGLSRSKKDMEIAIQTWLRRASDRRASLGRITKKF